MNRRNNVIVLGVLTVACVLLIVASTIRDGWLTPLRTGVGRLLTPVQSTVNRLGVSIYDAVTEKRKLDEVLGENEERKKTISELMMENTRLEQESYELQRLRELYRLDQNYGKYEKVAARVIAKDPAGWFDVFRIDKGSDDGIRADMNVLAGDGLVGIVTDVGSNYATVRSIIDDSSRVSAMAMQSGDNAIVAGSMELYRDGVLILEDIDANADINDGDKIVTSNISSKYLPGILVGYASGIETDSNRLTKSGYLIPAADFEKLQEVLVITQLK